MKVDRPTGVPINDAADLDCLEVVVGYGSDDDVTQCPRCHKWKPCPDTSLHDGMTAVCRACYETEVYEKAGAMAPWCGKEYWRISVPDSETRNPVE